MELLNPSISNKPLIGPRSSFLTRKFPFRTRKTKYLCNKRPVSFSFSSSTTFRVSAHFGGPTNRRNSLRKKLINDPQVNQTTSDSQSLNPSAVNSVKLSDSKYEPSIDKLGESGLSSKLEVWVDQYNKDVAFWGIGSSHIFTVFHDLEGNIKRVFVDESEIAKRVQVGKKESLHVNGVTSKILHAKSLAREMESGRNVIPRTSSVAKFVLSKEESGFVKTISGAVFRPEFIPVVTGYGKIAVCSLVAIWALTKLFSFSNKEVELSQLEKEMVRRKIKSRKEKDGLKKAEVEVVQESSMLPMMPTEKPKLDKQELMRNIIEAKTKTDKLLLVDSSDLQTNRGKDFNERIQEIRAMAREARDIELREQTAATDDREEKRPVNETQIVAEQVGEVANAEIDATNVESGRRINFSDTQMDESVDGPAGNGIGYVNGVSSEKDKVIQSSEHSGLEVSKDVQSNTSAKGHKSNDWSAARKPRIIRSVKEAREFLAMKGKRQSLESQVDIAQEGTFELGSPCDKTSGGKASQINKIDKQVFKPPALDTKPGSLLAPGIQEDLIPEVKEFVLSSVGEDNSNNPEEGFKTRGHQNSETPLVGNTSSSKERRQSVGTENWIEKNFHEVEPIVKKIGEGIRNNYKLARERVNQNSEADVVNLDFSKDDTELDWMKDDDLREIVFQVRDNELLGRDPFYLIDAKDKIKFFKGLEERVEKENEKLLQVHEYLHSNIENLDYGADGISVYDKPEKFVPRWKGPPLETSPAFLNNFQHQQTAITENADAKYLVKDGQDLNQKLTESMVNENASSFLSNNVPKKDAKSSKTIIEGSDGSVRAGKKSGKEFWQHTKKWSRGFLESYNAESDPEIKSIMKDIGKDLDRWITEEEIQDAADLMEKLPERNKKFVEKKMKKLKREMELFGPQAVVSKYREYADDNKEDYLWWLDLPHILCIELYATQNGKQEIGFYSLEMAADLELEPKPRHVIAFEDARDCKDFCYILQAHMEMLGMGLAFVVPRPPKDAFREAKANGFGVTVIRKKELELNIDQTLEEVEEQITEIGSKMYHDELMRERSVDINALMKGVFGFTNQPSKTKRKKSKRALKKPRKGKGDSAA